MDDLDNAGVSQDQSHLSDHQADPGSSLSSITSAEGQQGFEAAMAVLDTNELLHMIIAEVPHKYRCSLRRVSKTWKAAVMKIGFTLERVSHQQRRPDSKADVTFRQTLAFEYRAGLPKLSSAAVFEINPVFIDVGASWKYRLPGQDWKWSRKYYQRFMPSLSEIAGIEQQFITNPPITQVLMSTGGCGKHAAILRVHGGIRLEDFAS